MAVKQGQRYRVIAPQLPEGTRAARVNGRVIEIDRYTSKFTDADGTKLVVVDLIGDVINASTNVPYPRGSNADYRNVQWIEENIERFELIEEPTTKED